MKKFSRALIAVLALTMVMAFMPGMAFAEGTASQKATVTFSAGIPDQYDMVNEKVTATGDLAETYFPKLKAVEADGVSYADVLVAATIQKYGKDKVTEYLGLSRTDYGSLVTKQFGHDIVGYYFTNGKYNTKGVSEIAVKDGDRLFAGAYSDKNYSDQYSYLTKTAYTATAGEKITVEVSVFNSVNSRIIKPAAATLNIVDKSTLNIVDKSTVKLTAVKTSYKNGVATFTLTKPGTYTIAPTGTVNIKDWRTGADIAGKIFGEASTVTVKAPKIATAKITGLKAGTKKATVSVKKIKGAKYQIKYKKKGSSKWSKVNTKLTKKTIKNLKKGKKYSVKVRAYKTVGGKNYFGKFSATKTVKVK